MLQALKPGVSAVTSDGRDVGTLFRIVVDVTTRRVTAVTVQRRLIESGNLLKPGGWERPRDLVTPIATVTGADDGEVRLNLTEDEFLALPPYVYHETAQPEPGVTPSADFRAEDVTMRAGALLGGGVYLPPRDQQENRAPSERHISHATEVWRTSPHTHAGGVDIVLMDDTSNALAALVVRHGTLFHHEVVVPAAHIVDLFDDLVHVDISDEAWHNLDSYSAESS